MKNTDKIPFNSKSKGKPISSMPNAVLILADGTLMEGFSFGACGTSIGEVVFNTGMTGYQEVMTDPSYAGQLVTFTYPEFGNTGINSQDDENPIPHVRGIIIRELSDYASNWRTEEELDDWLKRHKIVGIRGIDTRALVRHIREVGTMNGAISNDHRPYLNILKEIKSAPTMDGLNLADTVSTSTKYHWNKLTSTSFDQRLQNSSQQPYRVIAIDFGIKRAILERLAAHGCDVTVLSSNSTIEDVMAEKPEGVFLSNGPGDPATVKSGIRLAQNLIKYESIPLFGICMGHQILGLALGGETFKLNYGHRGLNHPCGRPGQVEITSQNHGFALKIDSLPSDIVQITHLNLNDRTVAALAHRSLPIFGVQYHPEASPGPHDADHHFGRFVALMAARRN
uniref:Carbamoyl phosphate synthase small chain n=1 Tax=Paulinella longichromatophora TaxID=1708747 RepID=A0A2H4ZNK0_9EUKA|nr:carbamoyl-phosphate synthase small subunit [Paulinella longichromatophora]